jgi:hypothetical protein
MSWLPAGVKQERLIQRLIRLEAERPVNEIFAFANVPSPVPSNFVEFLAESDTL